MALLGVSEEAHKAPAVSSCNARGTAAGKKRTPRRGAGRLGLQHPFNLCHDHGCSLQLLSGRSSQLQHDSSNGYGGAIARSRCCLRNVRCGSDGLDGLEGRFGSSGRCFSLHHLGLRGGLRDHFTAIPAGAAGAVCTTCLSTRARRWRRDALGINFALPLGRAAGRGLRCGCRGLVLFDGGGQVDRGHGSRRGGNGRGIFLLLRRGGCRSHCLGGDGLGSRRPRKEEGLGHAVSTLLELCVRGRKGWREEGRKE